MANTVIAVKTAIMAIHLVAVCIKYLSNVIFFVQNIKFWDVVHLFLDCDCDFQGTLSEVCDKGSEGNCLCKEGYEKPRCDRCLPGYYNYPECIKCNCSTVGSASFACDPTTGKCPCLNNFASKQCSQCSAGYYDYPQCLRESIWTVHFVFYLHRNFHIHLDFLLFCSMQLWNAWFEWHFM